MNESGMGIYLKLFLSFFKIGLFTFGGGWAMVPIIEREVVDKYGWIDRPSFVDSLAISQSLPGILAVNISIIVGNRLRGVRGSAVATLGTVLPSFIIILLIAIFFSTVNSNPVVERIFKGIRPAVVALIVAPVLTTAKASRITLRTVWIPLVCALLIWQMGVSPVYLILAGALGGMVYYKYIERRMRH